MRFSTLVIVLIAAACSDSRAQEAREQPSDPGMQDEGNFASCVGRTDDETNLSDDQALSLCAGAGSNGPIECFLAADDALILSDQQQMDLCRYARSIQPVSCFVASERETNLSTQQILDICAAATAGG